MTDVAASIAIDDSLAGAIRAWVLWKAWTKEKEFELAQREEARYERYVRAGLRFVKLQAGDRANQIDLRTSSEFTQNGQWA